MDGRGQGTQDDQMKTEYLAFPARADRTRYIAKRFDAYLRESVLDVGCFEAPLRDLLTEAKYTGVDMVGNPDIVLNLEQCELLKLVQECLLQLYQLFAHSYLCMKC